MIICLRVLRRFDPFFAALKGNELSPLLTLLIRSRVSLEPLIQTEAGRSFTAGNQERPKQRKNNHKNLLCVLCFPSQNASANRIKQRQREQCAEYYWTLLIASLRAWPRLVGARNQHPRVAPVEAAPTTPVRNPTVYIGTVG